MKKITIYSTQLNQVQLNFAFIKWILFFGMFFSIQNSFSQTNTWDGSSSNNWSTSANWSLNHVPTSSEDVVIANVTTDPRYAVASATVKSITIQNGANLVFERAATYTLTVTGSVTVNSGGTFTIRGAGGIGTSTLTIGEDFVNNGSVDFVENSNINVIFNGSATQTISGSGATMDLSAVTLSNASSFVINRAIDVDRNWTNNGKTVSGSGSVTFSNSTTIGGTTSTAFPNLTISGTVSQGINTTVTGNYNQTAGAYTVTPGSTAYSLAVSGDFTQSAGTFNVTGSAATAGATVTVGGNTSIFSINMEANSSNTASTVLFQANGDATFTGSSTTTSLDWMAGGNTGTAYNITFGIKGNFNWSNTSGRPYTSGSGRAKGFVFNGTGTLASPQTLTYSGSNSATSYGLTFEINPTTAVKLLTGLALGTQNNPASTFTINGILDAQSFVISGSSAAGVKLNSGATLVTANTAGVTGTITATSPTYSSSANYIFDGTANQTTSFSNTTMANLTIDNTGTTNKTVTINTAAPTITGNLAVTSGILDSAAFQIIGNTANNFTLASGTTFRTSGAGTSNFPTLFTSGHCLFNAASTVEYYGTTQTVSSTPGYGNLNISAAGTKTAGGTLTIAGNLNIATSAILNPGSLGTHTANTLTLGGLGTAAAKFGSTSTSATPTVYKTNTYFTAGTSGYITVSSGSCNATITVASIGSNNAFNSAFAKNGDVITVTFTTSETPDTMPTVTINGTSASVSGSGTSYSATKTVSGDANGLATFSISYATPYGCVGNRNTVTNASSVTVDTVAPTIPAASIVSNNAITTFARAGNVITVSFSTSEIPAATPTATISGGTALVSGSGTSYTATRTVLSGDANGTAPFSISIRDTAGNTSTQTTTTNSSSVTVDTAAPAISTASIASNNANPVFAKAGDVITLSFTTSETPIATPTVTISGGSATVSGSGTSWAATRVVLAGDTNGVAPFSIAISDAAGNTASRTSTTDATSVTVDTVAPIISTATIASNNATSTLAKVGDTITLTFTTNQTPAATPVATINGLSATVSGSGTSYTATRVVGGGDTNGVVPFSINIADASGNSASRTTVSSGSSVTVDTVAPTILTATIASNNTNNTLARTGNVITLSFTTNQTPSVTPVVTINGLSATVSGSGTSYTATRTVAGGDSNGVVPFSITIRDAAGNTSIQTTTTNGSSVTVDTITPAISAASIASSNANSALAKAGDSITLTFTTSETPNTIPTVTISGGAASVTGSGTSWTATRTVLAGDANGVASFSIVISDAAGNTASGTTTTDTSSVTIDTVAPTIPTGTIASDNATTSLAKSGNTITLSFTTSQTPAATPVVTMNGASATVSGSGTSYTATKIVSGGDTNGVVTFAIVISDAAGNTASRATTTNSSSVTIDTIAPDITSTSIVSNNANTSLAKSGNIIALNFTTSETPASTPVVTIAGISATVSGSGTSYTATKTVLEGDANGVATFSIGISDAAGNSVSQTSTTDGSSVTIDTVVPTFTSVTIASNNANASIAGTGDVITLSFTTSESLSASPTVIIDGASASVSGSGTSWTATKIVTSCSDNIVSFSISLSDTAGNPASQNTTTDGSQVTINPTPSATIVSNGGTICSGFNATFTVNGSNGATLNYTITGQTGNQQLVLTGVNQIITMTNATSNVTLTLGSVVNANCTSSVFDTGTSTVIVNALPTVTASNVTGCSGTDIALSGSPLGGTFSVANPYNDTNSATYTYSYTDENNCSATSLPANITVVAIQTWYLDADNDGYSSNSASSITDCNRPIGGYKLSSELAAVGTDCNDNVLAINPGVTDTGFNNIDENCDNDLFDGHAPVVVNINTPNGALPLMTTTISAATATNTTPYSGAAVTYIFRVSKMNAPSSVVYVSSATPSFALSSASNAAHSSTYHVTATAVVNGEEQPYNGNTRTYTTPAVPTIPGTTQTGQHNVQCVYTLAKIDSYIYANNSTTYGATKFEFVVERVGASPAEIVTVSANAPSFKLTNISGIPGTIKVLYGATYKIKVRYGYDSYGSPVWSAYGTNCLISTPSLAVPMISCGPLASINASIYATGATAGANLYEFKVTRIVTVPENEDDSQTDDITEETISRNVNNFKLTMLNQLFVGLQKEYNVSLRYKINSYGTQQFSPWTTANCSVYTPDFPATSIIDEQCGVPGVPSTLTQYVYANLAPGATRYHFRLLRTTAPVYDYTVWSTDRFVKLIEFPGLTAGLTYSISVVAELYGETADFANTKDCSIVAPASTPTGPTKNVVAIVAPKFLATAYPNPFATSFLLDVKTVSQSVVNLKAYDMIGRLIEQRDVQASEISNTTIGERYPSGVYNVVVSQDDDVQTVRVVKR